MKARKWSVDQLRDAVQESRSYRQVLLSLGLREAGGNYKQVREYIARHHLDVSHFSGRGWSRGVSKSFLPKIALEQILVRNSTYQTFKLKNRLFRAGLKKPACEECGWAQRSPDGRLPLELDHINGNSRDHRLENLRVLCPNCHSLKPTHRGAKRK